MPPTRRTPGVVRPATKDTDQPAASAILEALLEIIEENTPRSDPDRMHLLKQALQVVFWEAYWLIRPFKPRSRADASYLADWWQEVVTAIWGRCRQGMLDAITQAENPRSYAKTVAGNLASDARKQTEALYYNKPKTYTRREGRYRTITSTADLESEIDQRATAGEEWSDPFIKLRDMFNVQEIDLIKALISGKSIGQIAAEKGMQPRVVRQTFDRIEGQIKAQVIGRLAI